MVDKLNQVRTVPKLDISVKSVNYKFVAVLVLDTTQHSVPSCCWLLLIEVIEGEQHTMEMKFTVLYLPFIPVVVVCFVKQPIPSESLRNVNRQTYSLKGI